jgi:hypothetical protein
MHNHGELLLCTHCNDEFFLSAITLSLARQCYTIHSLSHDWRFSIAGNFVCLDIVWFQDAGKLYLCQDAFLDHLLVQDDGWIPVDCQIFFGFSIIAGPSHKNMDLDFHGITGLGLFVLVLLCFLVPLFRIGFKSRVTLNILSILLLSRILSIPAFPTLFSLFGMTFLLHQFLLLVSQQLVQRTSTSLSPGVVSFGLFFFLRS